MRQASLERPADIGALVTMARVARIGAAQIADIVGAAPGVWSVVVVSSLGMDTAIASLKDEYEFAASELGEGTTIASEVQTARELIRELRKTNPEDICLLKGFERWTQAQVEELDLVRNAFANRARVTIVTTPEGARRLSENAPNLWSWIGARCFELEASVGVMDKEARLASLRTFFNQSDDEVERLAEAGDLPTEPAYAEWLALLGRSDLLGK